MSFALCFFVLHIPVVRMLICLYLTQSLPLLGLLLCTCFGVNVFQPTSLISFPFRHSSYTPVVRTTWPFQWLLFLVFWFSSSFLLTRSLSSFLYKFYYASIVFSFLHNILLSHLSYWFPTFALQPAPSLAVSARYQAPSSRSSHVKGIIFPSRSHTISISVPSSGLVLGLVLFWLPSWASRSVCLVLAMFMFGPVPYRIVLKKPKETEMKGKRLICQWLIPVPGRVIKGIALVHNAVVDHNPQLSCLLIF